jgi:hypothetical protein
VLVALGAFNLTSSKFTLNILLPKLLFITL